MRILSSKANSTLIALALTLLCYSAPCFSQTKPTKYPCAKLANVDIKVRVIHNYDEILSNPQLIITHPGWKIERYCVSYLLLKKNEYFGPYIVKGARMSDKSIADLKKIKELGFTDVKVFFEDIKGSGPDMQTRSFSPTILTIKLN